MKQKNLGYWVSEIAARPYTPAAQPDELEQLSTNLSTLRQMLIDLSNGGVLSPLDQLALQGGLSAWFDPNVKNKIQLGYVTAPEPLDDIHFENFLRLAAYHNNTKIIRTLHANEININAGENVSDTALHVAAKQGHVNAIQALYTAGANVNALNKEGQTALEAMDTRRHPKTARLLINMMEDEKPPAGYAPPSP